MQQVFENVVILFPVAVASWALAKAEIKYIRRLCEQKREHVHVDQRPTK